jgi:alanine racemase
MATGTASAVLTIDLAAIVDNWRSLSTRVHPARCAAVVKADAYGLGAEAVVRALLAAGCREFFVALVDEGIALVDALGPGWPGDARVHVLHGAFAGAERDCLEKGLVPVLNSLDQIERWQALARAVGRELPAAIHGDTGMARLGLSPAELAQLDAHPARLHGIAPTLVMSHLVSAELLEDPLNGLQRERFEHLRAHWPAVPGSLVNSSGIFLGPAFHAELARPGAALYGVAPIAHAPNPMRPVVRLQGRLIQTRDVAAGDGVGYNHIWHAKWPSRIATVSVGYADGYLRSLSSGARLRLHGRTLPLVGRVSMDTVTIDVTGVPEEQLHPGTLFDLIDEVQDINALAAQAGTNAYEILTNLGPRYQRQYLGT